jgi:hypothetical protein
MMRVYLAGPTRELGRVEKVAGWLAEYRGLVEIVEPWWERFRAAGADDSSLTRGEQGRHALRSLYALDCADLFWGLWPETYSAGTTFEYGYAYARAQTVITGRTSADCIFTARADYRDSSDQLGLVEVIRRAEIMRSPP